MIIHSPIISGSLTFADGATFTLPDNGVYSGSFSGSLQVHEVSSHIIPDTPNTYDLGSATNFFRDLYLSSGSANFLKGNGEVAFKLKASSAGKMKVVDANDDDAEIEVKEILLKDTSGNGNNIKLKVENGALKSKKVNNDDVEQTEEPSSELSGSFTGSVRDLQADGNATFNNAIDVTGTTTLRSSVNVTGPASLDGGIDVDGLFTVSDGTGNVSTTGTLAAGATTVTGLTANGSISGSGTLSAGATTLTSTVDVTGLASLDGGIDVDGAFTVADGTGNVSTSGTLSAGNTDVATLDASGLASLDGGIDVDGAFTVANSTGNVSTTGTLNADGNGTIGGTLGVTGNTTLSGTLSAGNTDVATLDASGLASLDGGVDVDGAFTVANSTGNVSTSGTLNVTGLTTVGVISGSAMDITGDLGVGGDLTVVGAMTTDGHILPALHNTYDLGSTTKFWRDLYLSSGSLYINGIQVLSTDGTDLTFQTDEGESTKILETANDTITLESVNGDITLTATGTGNIELDAPIQINAGKNILSSDGNAINFADDVSLGVNSIYAANLVGVISSSAITYDGNNIDVAGNTTIQGNLTVQGTQVQLNTTTLNIEDKNLLIASGAVDSAAANGGGITIDGADATITWVSADSNIAFNTAVNIPTDGLKINGTAVTSTAAELNLLDTAVAGTIVNSKAVVYGAAGEVNATKLQVGGVDITSTPAELNLLDNVSGLVQGDFTKLAAVDTTAAELNYVSGVTSAIQTQLDDKISLTGISATDAGGDGSFSYNNTTGVFTYTGPSATEVRAHFSGGTGVTITDGSIAIGQAVATNSSVTFATVSATGDIVAYASSDERLKDNIEVISNPIEKVQQLKGVTWNWNDNADELQKSLPNVGVIAQDVEKVLPQLVKDRDNGFKGVDYAKLTGLLIEAIKDQQTQIDELKSKLS